jgi:pimeloyl-ACP methyl ester carboxylesterase
MPREATVAPDAGPARRRPDPGSLARVAAASLVAWIGISLGLGVGVPWLLDHGESPTAVLGVATLVVGVAALAGAAVLLLRTLPSWWRLALLPWLLLLAVGTYSLSIALAVTHVSPTPVPDPPLMLSAGAEVAMTAGDGSTLHGWYLPGTNSAAVVVRHGAGSQRFGAAAQAAVLARHGYGVLLVDARGHGRSGGKAMDFGWHGEADTAAAVDLLARQPGVNAARIGVLGLSMGAEEAIGAAGRDRRIRAVVAEGATGRTAADKAWLSDQYGFAGLVQEQLDRITYGFVELFSEPAAPASLQESVAAAAPTPMLLIAASEVPDEATVARRLAAAAPDSVAVWIADGAGHTAALATDPIRWRQRVVSFFDAALLGRPEGAAAG